MADADDEQIVTAESGASATIPIQCSSLRKNHFVVIKGRPCKVVEMSTSKTGKHGHAKVNLTCLDIFTGKKLEDMCPSTHNMEQPVVKRVDYELIDIDDEGYATLMDENNTPKEDLKIPDGDVGKQIREQFDKGEPILLTVCSAMGEEAILGFKNKPSGKD